VYERNDVEKKTVESSEPVDDERSRCLVTVTRKFCFAPKDTISDRDPVTEHESGLLMTDSAP